MFVFSSVKHSPRMCRNYSWNDNFLCKLITICIAVVVVQIQCLNYGYYGYI